MEQDYSRYAQRGVSSAKSEVKQATRKLDPGLYPGAFCKILPAYFGNTDRYCMIQHADGAGSKAALAYLVWKTTGNLDVWKGIAQDSLVMNLDDMACAGSMGPFVVTQTIARNKHLIPKEVIETLIEGCQEFCVFLNALGIQCYFGGGETADLADNTRTIIVDNTVSTQFGRHCVIDASSIDAPAYIVGFSSTGQALWEKTPNSGIGSNGLTNARHELLSHKYRSHKETYAPETPRNFVYCGEHFLDDKLPGDERFTIASALLSPTRTYLPLIYQLFVLIGRPSFFGFIHCTGGGQTKIGNFGKPGTVYTKGELFPTPPLFQFLRTANNTPWRDMYRCYNMGHRLEAVVRSFGIAQKCIEMAQTCGIDTKIIGRVDRDESLGNHRVVNIVKSKEEFTYTIPCN